jgi:hypothetical protein
MKEEATNMSTILTPSNDLMHPNDFVHAIINEVDSYAAAVGYPEIWKRLIQSSNQQEIEKIIVHRLIKGYHQEIYIRDVAARSMELAPNLKAQKALLQQVEDEHKHAMWVANELRKKGIDAELTRPSVEVQCMWDSFFGMAQNSNNFFVLISSLQLVVERGFGLQSTGGFAEAIADIDPEVSHLYAERIHRDELFHTVQLPESIIHSYATTVEAQNDVRLGIEKGRVLIRLLEMDANKSKPANHASTT